MKDVFLGIDIGGTNIKWIQMDDRGGVVEKGQMTTEDDSRKPEVWKQKTTSLIQQKKEHFQNAGLELRVGISAPGLVNDDNTMTVAMPERLKGIEGYKWGKELNLPVYALNDGHAACLAEYEALRSKGIQNMVLLTLGTGVGGGIIINGKLYQGHAQRAGHIGHLGVDINGPLTMTNMPGSLEYAIGNFSVAERTNGQYQNTKALVEAYNAGNPQAKKWWLLSIKKLAVALSSLNNVLAPEAIVLGGGIMAGAGNALLKPLKEYMATYEWNPLNQSVPLWPTQFGAFAGAIGAAHYCKSKQEKSRE